MDLALCALAVAFLAWPYSLVTGVKNTNDNSSNNNGKLHVSLFVHSLVLDVIIFTGFGLGAWAVKRSREHQQEQEKKEQEEGATAARAPACGSG